jgi:hypothetical protein
MFRILIIIAAILVLVPVCYRIITKLFIRWDGELSGGNSDLADAVFKMKEDKRRLQRQASDEIKLAESTARKYNKIKKSIK